MTDDKSLPKAARKRLQIEHAHAMTKKAALVKLADKICNVRDVAANPPAQWSEERRREYFEWAKAVVEGLKEPHPKLRKLFDKAYAASLLI